MIKALIDEGIDGDMMDSLRNDMVIHASYVFEEDADMSIDKGLQELLNRLAV